MTVDLSAALDRIEGLDEWSRARAALALVDVVRAVLGVHVLVPGWDVPKCGADNEVWPCATVRAATKAWEDGR